MKYYLNEIGHSEWIFQEIKYLSDLTNEKLDDFTLRIKESLEWINGYMEDVIDDWKSTLNEDYKALNCVGSTCPVVHEKTSNFTSQESFVSSSLFKNLGFGVFSSPLANINGDELIMDESESIDVNYDDILSEDNNFSIMEPNNEQNINLKYDSSSTRVMEMITEEDELDMDEEILNTIETKKTPKNNLEMKDLLILKDDHVTPFKDKSSQLNSLQDFCSSEDSLTDINIKKTIELEKDCDTIIVSEYKNTVSPIQGSDASHHLDSHGISNPETHPTSTSIMHSYFLPSTDNTSGITSFSASALSSSLNFASLPPREPLNTKKSLGKRVSLHGSFSEAAKTRKISESKLFGTLKQENLRDSIVSEYKSSENLKKKNVIVDEMPEKKLVFDEADKHDIGEKRLKAVFTSSSQRIHEALSSLRTAKSVSGHFKSVSAEQKLQNVMGTKSTELENDCVTLNQIPNITNDSVLGTRLNEVVSQVENEEYFVSKIDIVNKHGIDTNMEKERKTSFDDTKDSENYTDSNNENSIVDKSDRKARHRSSVIAMSTVSVMGAIQAARNSAAQAIRKATSVFFSPSSKTMLSKDSIENVPEQSLKTFNDSYDGKICLDSKRNSVCEVNLEKNIEISKNTTYKVEIEQSNDMIEKHNLIKTCDYGKETATDEARVLSKKSPSTLNKPISREEINPVTNKFSSDELSSENLKIQPVQQVKLTGLNSLPITKNKPVFIKVATASQRQADLAEKRKVQRTAFETSLQRSFVTQSSQNQENSSVTDATQYNNCRSQGPPTLSQSRPAKRLVLSKGIKALTAATLARKKEQEEKDKKLAHKKEIERRRQENLKKQEENKKQEQWHREDVQRKIQSEKVNDVKKKPLSQTIEHSSSIMKKVSTIPLDSNVRGPLEDIINNDGKNRDTLNVEVKPFKRILQDETVQENWNSFSAPNKSLFQEVKKRKTDDILQENSSSVPIQIPVSKKDSKDPFLLKSRPNEKNSYLYIQAMPQKHVRLLQNRYQENPQVLSLKSGKAAGPVVDTVKFSTDNIRFGEPSKMVSNTHQYLQSESIELPEIDSDYSDDDELKKQFKSSLPQWAESPELTQILKKQAKIDPDKIFGPMKPLQIEEIFRGKERAHARFRSRSSSANWSGQDRLTEQEIENYAKIMGYKT